MTNTSEQQGIMDNVIPEVQYTKTFIITAFGENAGGEILTMTYGMRFTNDCSVFPVINGGDRFAWTTIVRCLKVDMLQISCPTFLSFF